MPATVIDSFEPYIIEASNVLLDRGNPFDFIVDTWNESHVGDRGLGEAMNVSVGSTCITNSKGVHVKGDGISGKGKSDAQDDYLNLLPMHMKKVGSQSGKAAFYDKNLLPGTILAMDDTQIDQDIITTIKQSTSNFQQTTFHHSVKSQTAIELPIPPRTVWWTNAVDGFDDEQMGNRFISIEVDGSEEQDSRVYDRQTGAEDCAVHGLAMNDNVMVCRCIYTMLRENTYDILFPYVDAIDWNNKNNRRNYPMFVDVIRSVTLYRIRQREQLGNDYISTIEDFDCAVEIYKKFSKSNATNLSSSEEKIVEWMHGRLGGVTIAEIAKKMGRHRTSAVRLMNGPNGNGGLLAKVPGLNVVDASFRSDGGDRTDRHKIYTCNADITWKKYDDVVTIDRSKLDEAYESWLQRHESISTKKLDVSTYLNSK